MCGKATEIFARLCLVLKAIHVACDSLRGTPGCNSTVLTTEIGQTVQQIVNGGTSIRFVIDEATALKAYNLLESFQKAALLLSQHDINPRDTIDHIIQKLLRDFAQAPQIGGDFVLLSSNLVNDMRKLLYYEGSSIGAQNITKSNSPVAPIEQAMKELEKNGLGKTYYTKGSNHKRLMRFDKIKSVAITNDKSLGRKIQDLGLVFNDFVQRLRDIEMKESEEDVIVDPPVVTDSTKRDRGKSSSPQESNSKRSRENLVR